MEGILIIVIWILVILTTIAGYFIWEKSRKLVVMDKMSENNKDVINRYGYLRIMSIFVLIGLLIITIISFLEATESANYFKF